MRQRILLGLSLLLGLGFQFSGVATAASSPTKVVKQFLDLHLEGRFAEARGFTLEQANLSASIFSSWLFGSSGAGGSAPTADVFLSRKFVQAFRYSILGAVEGGENQVYVAVRRTSPNLVHLYTWALAAKRGAPPYEQIEAIDTYLTKVNFPVEESQMQFTLISEADEWYITAVRDEKFVQLYQQVSSQQPLSPAPPSPVAGLPWQAEASAPASFGAAESKDLGRKKADAQFNATLQSFNYAVQSTPPSGNAPGHEEEKKPSLLSRIFGGGKKDTVAKEPDERLKRTFDNLRDALARYASLNNEAIPEPSQIYDWQSLRRVLSRHCRRGINPLPATEGAAGFRFIRYDADVAAGDYTLLVELLEPHNGSKRAEITPYGVDRVN